MGLPITLTVLQSLKTIVTRPDTRAAILLMLFVSILFVKASPSVLACYAVLLLVVFLMSRAYIHLPAGTFRRTLLFTLFWPMLKFAVSAFPLCYSLVAFHVTGTIPSFFSETHFDHEVLLNPEQILLLTHEALRVLEPVGRAAVILFLRLSLLFWVALLLTAVYSARELGLGLTWFASAISPANGWKLALGITLMMQYLPYTHKLFAELQKGATARGLPSTGIKGLRLLIPRLFTLLAGHTWEQAVAVAGRGLDTPAAWQDTSPFILREQGLAFLLSLLCLFVFYSPMGR